MSPTIDTTLFYPNYIASTTNPQIRGMTDGVGLMFSIVRPILDR